MIPSGHVLIFSFFFLLRVIDFLNFSQGLTLICGLLALSNYNVKGLQRQRQFLVKKSHRYKNRKTHHSTQLSVLVCDAL